MNDYKNVVFFCRLAILCYLCSKDNGKNAMKYPIGIQTFEKIIKQKMAYVDKTAQMYRLANGTQNNFLSRPRRFGKSLLVTTLQAYFEGRHDLFEGLAIEKLETEWTVYPVIHLDLSRSKYYDIANLHSTLDLILREYEAKYNITAVPSASNGNRLDAIIQAAVRTTGKQAVVLIDEYDAPMLDSISDETLQKQIRDIMRDFFSPLKAQEGNLRFVFLTGITKFSQLSIFSELNNIKNISMDDAFSDICGITEAEMLGTFKEGITELAKANGMTYDEAVGSLRRQYDGYHFSAHGPAMYNPYSLLNALNDKQLNSYWFATGTPTFLLELIQERNILLPQLENVVATSDQFDTPTDRIGNPIPVLYQSGYITIKSYEYGAFTLGFPNEEVREGFNRSMLNYIAPDYGLTRTSFGIQFSQCMRADDIDGAMEALRVFLAGFPYDIHHNREDYYQAILYTVFVTLNFTIRAEVRTAKGRVDLVVSTKSSVFVMELKLDKSADEALAQIDSKDYALPYKADGRKVFKVGVNFSTKEKTVVEWKYIKA